MEGVHGVDDSVPLCFLRIGWQDTFESFFGVLEGFCLSEDALGWLVSVCILD